MGALPVGSAGSWLVRPGAAAATEAHKRAGQLGGAALPPCARARRGRPVLRGAHHTLLRAPRPQVVVDAGLLTQSELEACITSEYNPVRCASGLGLAGPYLLCTMG
jgi:hypothetical protein